MTEDLSAIFEHEQVKQAADTVDVHGAENSKNIELQALKVCSYNSTCQ